MRTVQDVLEALDRITGGRVVKGPSDISSGKNPFVVSKSSHIPGKAIVETPGLVFGDPSWPVRKAGMLMTLTESGIELASALGIDLVVAHHPIADAANSGGVPLRNYLGLYRIAAIELHEAFHGLHPGIPYLHGHRAFRVDVAYGGIPGNILFVGKPLEDVNRLGDMVERLARFMNYEEEERLLDAERDIRRVREIWETSVAVRAKVLAGDPNSQVGTVLHIFPHTGFTVEHLERAKAEHPEATTVLATISRVPVDHALVAKARELGMHFVVGNSHAVEIFENWLPLSYALRDLLPEVEYFVLRERVSATRLEDTGNESIRQYASRMADQYLVKKT
ncbi:MAG TPA: NGG1p interacting factor NIF3 [Bacillota bacterium]|nr:NGG1p interacting factor NIF3 [Bacillota bacterium]